MIKCKVCGREFDSYKSLSSHIRKHKLTKKDYYNLYMKKENEDICPICGKSNIFDYLTTGYRNHCSVKCSRNDNATKLKQKNTCIERYGYGSSNQSPSVKKKKEITCVKKYGVSNPSKVDDVKKRKKLTCLKNYGVENPNQSKEVQCRTKETYLKKYGVDHFSKTDQFKEKYKSTCLDKFGVDNIFKLNSVVKKIQKKRKITCLKKYGVDNYAKTDEFRELSRVNILKQISRQRNNGEPIYPIIGKKENECLNILETSLDKKIKRQYNTIGYYLDGYISDLNIAIEFDEHEHQNHINKDIKRENDIRSVINCRFFRIKEKDWDENKNKVINEFKRVIENV